MGLIPRDSLTLTSLDIGSALPSPRLERGLALDSHPFEDIPVWHEVLKALYDLLCLHSHPVLKVARPRYNLCHAPNPPHSVSFDPHAFEECRTLLPDFVEGISICPCARTLVAVVGRRANVR